MRVITHHHACCRAAGLAGGSRRRARGYSLFQIIVATILMTLTTVGVINSTMSTAARARFERAITQAKTVAQYADVQGRRVTAVAHDPATDHYTYTFGYRTAAFTNATVLQAEFSGVPTVSEYGTAFSYRTQGGLGEAKFTVPAARAAYAREQSYYPKVIQPSGDVDVYVPSIHYAVPARSRYQLMVKKIANGE